MSQPRTVRVYWGRFKGRQNFNYNWDIITARSVVHIAACEYTPAAGPVFSGPPPDPAPTPWVTGAANITVHGICPHSNPNGVGFIVTVDWDQPLPIVTDITVFDVPETVDLGGLVNA